MAVLKSNVILSRSYKKIGDDQFEITSNRDITETVSIADVYVSLSTIVAEIKNIDRQVASKLSDRKVFIDGYNNMSEKAGEERGFLLDNMEFPTEFKEELLDNVAKKTLPNIFSALDSVLANISAGDDEVKALNEKRITKVDLYNDIVGIMVDIKKKFRDELEVPELYSDELLVKKEEAEPDCNVKKDAS